MSSATGTIRNTRVIAIGNQKGGVGKTTNTVHIAAALAEKGRRCLIFDLDMNHGATRHFGIPSQGFLGSFEVLIGEEAPEDVVLTGEEDDVALPENLHLIPARRNLEGIDQALAARSKFTITQDVLMEPLGRLLGRYDYVFLDTAPNATTPTIAAYKAADWFLLSAMPDPFAIAGLSDALQDIEDAQQQGNPDLTLLGVVLVGVDKRTRLSHALTEYVERIFAVGDEETLKFRTVISRSTVIPQAQKLGQTVLQSHGSHKVAEQYRRLAQEFEERINRMDRGGCPASEPQTMTVNG